MADDRWYAVMRPKVAYGYWDIQRTIPFFRWLGRKTHNKYIYWLGFQVRWIPGLFEIAKDWDKIRGGVIENIGIEMMEAIDEMAQQAVENGR